jgi:hypothetical protein
MPHRRLEQRIAGDGRSWSRDGFGPRLRERVAAGCADSMLQLFQVLLGQDAASPLDDGGDQSGSGCGKDRVANSDGEGKLLGRRRGRGLPWGTSVRDALLAARRPAPEGHAPIVD